MKFKIFSLGFMLLTVSLPLMAVDGYKDVKFGSSITELKSAKLCSWKTYHDENVKGMDSYYCDNFKFSGKNSIAVAFFINGKFERFVINIPTSNLSSVIESIKKKYGSPTSAFTSEEFDDVKAHGGEINVKFDNDTVIVSLSRSTSTKEDSAYLIYSSTIYNDAYKKLQEKNIESDI